MTDQEFLACMKVLGDPVRLGILNMLRERPAHSYEFLAGLSITQPTLSHHMKVLREAEFVTYRQTPQWKVYSLNTLKLGAIIQYLNSLEKKEWN